MFHLILQIIVHYSNFKTLLTTADFLQQLLLLLNAAQFTTSQWKTHLVSPKLQQFHAMLIPSQECSFWTDQGCYTNRCVAALIVLVFRPRLYSSQRRSKAFPVSPIFACVKASKQNVGRPIRNENKRAAQHNVMRYDWLFE